MDLDQTPECDADALALTQFGNTICRLKRRKNVLSQLSAAERDQLMRAGAVKRYLSGQAVFSQGAPHDYTYVILHGVVRASYLSHNNREYTVAYWPKGDIVGGPYFLNDGTTYLWSGHAVEPTELLALPGNTLRALCLQMPQLAVAMLDVLGFKIHWFSLLLQIIGTQSVEGRLGILMLGLGAIYGTKTTDGLLIRYTFTQSDLGKMLGVSRQWVNNALGHLQKKGALKIVKGRFVIQNVSVLKDFLGPFQ